MMYQAMYKCRLCGNKYLAGAPIPHKDAFSSLSGITDSTAHTSITMIHHCFDDSLGIADFLGYKEVSMD